MGLDLKPSWSGLGAIFLEVEASDKRKSKSFTVEIKKKNLPSCDIFFINWSSDSSDRRHLLQEASVFQALNHKILHCEWISQPFYEFISCHVLVLKC